MLGTDHPSNWSYKVFLSKTLVNFIRDGSLPAPGKEHYHLPALLTVLVGFDPIRHEGAPGVSLLEFRDWSHHLRKVRLRNTKQTS